MNKWHARGNVREKQVLLYNSMLGLEKKNLTLKLIKSFVKPKDLLEIKKDERGMRAGYHYWKEQVFFNKLQLLDTYTFYEKMAIVLPNGAF